MAAPRYSLILAALLCSCAHSSQQQNLAISNSIDGCFTLKSTKLLNDNEPVLVEASIGPGSKENDCPCKSASIQYSAYQKQDKDVFHLLSGHFSVLGTDNVVLPVAVQKRLMFSDVPLSLDFSCSSS